jgi:hypothetical protein
LIKAIQSKTILRINLANSSSSLSSLLSFIIAPEQGNCFSESLNFSNLTDEQKLFCQSSVEEIQTEVLNANSIDSIIQGLKKSPIDSFLWASTLYASRGRLLAGYSENSYMQLKRWPDFSMFAHEPEHFRIAAFMLKKPTQLKTIALKTGLPIEQVINFFNAAVILKLVDIKSNYQQTSQVKNVNTNEKQSILKSVLKRLIG